MKWESESGCGRPPRSAPHLQARRLLAPVWQDCSQSDSAALSCAVLTGARRLLLPWIQCWGRKLKGTGERGVSREGPFSEAGFCDVGDGQVLSRESCLCIHSVNFQLPGKALSRGRGSSKFALASPETSLEDSVFLP